jgi:enoyl-CoA hydratase
MTATYEGYELLAISRANRILTVTLNRPEVRNATNALMHQELVRVFGEIRNDTETNVVVLTGAGEKAFSAGGDVESLVYAFHNQSRWFDAMTEARAILDGLVSIDQPIIARVNGDAYGLGATLAVFCDIIIAVDTARIADPHVSVGLVAGDGGAVIWPQLIGYAKAKRYLLTGDPIGAVEAAEIGLITEAVPRDKLDERVDALATKMANGATLAIRLTKRAVNMRLRQELDSLIEAHLGLETLSHLHPDHLEALNAFKERRPPNYKRD